MKRNILIETEQIEKIFKRYFEQIYVNEYSNLGEIFGLFLVKYSLPKLIQEKNQKTKIVVKCATSLQIKVWDM